MNNQAMYFDNPFMLEFDANVIEIVPLPENKSGAVLDQTYFYPTGGGQEHDTGHLGAAAILDVTKDQENGRVIHVLDCAIELGPVHARIDKDRRLRHMQHHTAQHLLTHCFIQVLNLDTLSANINGYSPSTLDIPFTALKKATLDEVENLANQVIYEDLPVKSYIVTPEELRALPLRRKSSVSENIRIVEIDHLDYTPCGGTHCLSTGQIGSIKILKTERPNNDRTRIFFAAGLQAADLFREYYETVTSLSSLLGTSVHDLTSSVQRQTARIQDVENNLKVMRLELVEYEAKRLVETGQSIKNGKLVCSSFDHRPTEEFRALADGLKKIPEIISVITNFDGQKFALIVTSTSSNNLPAKELLAKLLQPVGGRGGGDATIAQGGGQMNETGYQEFKQSLPDLIKNLIS
jgi:alanyl-tRNA synthetase